MCINNACTNDDQIFINKLMSTIIPNQAPWEDLSNFPKYEQFPNANKTNVNKMLYICQNYRDIPIISNKYDKPLSIKNIDVVPFVNNNVKNTSKICVLLIT